mgnify:CR=1 FL=1
MYYLLTLDFPPPYNLGEKVLAGNIAKVLSDISRNDFTVLCRMNRRIKYNSVFIQGSGNEYFDSVRIAMRLRKLCKNDSAIVHLIGISYSVAIPILRAFKHAGLKLVIYYYMLEHYYYLRGLRRLLKSYYAPKFCSRLADAVVATSPLIAERLTMLGLNHVHYVPPPIDCEVFKPIDRFESLRRLSNRFSIDPRKLEGALVILYMGHVTPMRFPYVTVLKVLRQVIRDGFSAQLLIFTPSFRYNEMHAVKIRSIAESIGLEKHVSIFVRNVDQSEKPFVYNLADLFLFPALEPSAIDPPLTVLEAMACGKPVLASNVQSIPQIIKNGVNGFLVQSVNQLNEILTKLRKSHHLDYIGGNARKTILRNFSFDKVRESFILLCQL